MIDTYGDIPDNPFSKLSANELVVLGYMAKGLRPSEIASAMNITSATASTYKMRIFNKTGTQNEVQLIALANAYNVV